MRDDLGDRMKRQYEDRTRYFLPRRTFTILRVDGKAFHTLTKGFERPYDTEFVKRMCNAAVDLCVNVQGSVLAYTQSDEISVLITDFTKITTEAWFDGNVQKMASIGASIATCAFNGATSLNACFDGRVFTIPDRIEVYNYFVWRQRDAVRNSINSLAQKHFSHKELQNLNTDEVQEKLFQERGINWNDCPPAQKRGIVVLGDGSGDTEIPIFSQSDYLQNLIPKEPGS